MRDIERPPDPYPALMVELEEVPEQDRMSHADAVALVRHSTKHRMPDHPRLTAAREAIELGEEWGVRIFVTEGKAWEGAIAHAAGRPDGKPLVGDLLQAAEAELDEYGRPKSR